MYDLVNPYALSATLGEPYMARILYNDSSPGVVMMILQAIPRPLGAIPSRHGHQLCLD